jgi:hypothetical protein
MRDSADIQLKIVASQSQRVAREATDVLYSGQSVLLQSGERLHSIAR